MSNNFNRLAVVFEGWLDGPWHNHDIFSGLNTASLSATRTGGKRFRPVLCLTVGELLDVSPEKLRPYALAIEMIHTASLIHDDLPGLDNADERRGRPSVHREFGEAAAIMAGDLLISEAFRVIAESENSADNVKCRWIAELARANALICSGQLREITMQNGGAEMGNESPQNSVQNKIIEEKTAALIRASVMGAPILLGSRLEPEKQAFWSDFGTKLGILFQLRDDQLDKEAGEEHQRSGEFIFNELTTIINEHYSVAAKRLRELVEFVWARRS